MITWLASYPKSGNTWLRLLLTNYLGPGTEPADINRLGGGPMAAYRGLFDEWAAVESAALADDVVQRSRPELYRHVAASRHETVFMKVHDRWSLTDRGEPLFPPEITAGVVYILRNPLDVVPSLAHHFGVGAEEAAAMLCDREFAIARRHSSDAMPVQLRQPLGSWSDHVHSWLETSGARLHLVRYEDLRADTAAAFAAVLAFCGLEVEQEQLARAVAWSSFGQARTQETERGFAERPVSAKSPFFRRGEVDSWRDELSPEIAGRIRHDHGETMRQYGYR